MLVLLLFIGHYSSISFFYHTHTIEGITFSHSHFRGFDNPQKSTDQTHSSNELQLIQEFNQITWNSDLHFAAVETPVSQLINVFICKELQLRTLFSEVYSPLRAPPVLIA